MRSLLYFLFLDFSRDRSFMNPSRQGGGEEGFTLVELMVVIVILGLLATVVMINVLPSQEKAMATKARADIATLEQAMEMYRLDNLSYPSGGSGLQALVGPPAGLTQPGRYRPGGYIKSLPNDPWGRPYQLSVPGRKGSFDIYSLGGDGAPGGEGENADIYGGEG
jgi:general secretion pathway protein G